MQRNTFTKLALLLVMAGALVLAGCSSSDDSGVEQDLRDQLAALEGDLAAAQQAQSAAEAAEAAAKQAQAAAEMAQAEAETERDAANVAKGAAEAAQMTAEMAQADAEAAQMMAEQAQMDAKAAQAMAEQAQAAAEAAQAMAEGDRDQAQALQAQAEMAQAAAETARMTAEEAQRMAVAAQATAEAERGAALQAQADAEAAQMMAEQAQADAEAAQMMAEQAQADAEAAQMMAEDERDAALEAMGDAGEALKTAQEAQRMAENARDAALQAQADAEAAQMMAEDERDAARVAQGTAQARLEQAQTDLEAAQMRVSELEMLIGDAVDPAEGSLNERLAAANNMVMQLQDMIGEYPGEDGTDGSGLKGDLATARADLMAKQQELDDANDKVTELQDDLATKTQELMTANARIAQLEQQQVAQTSIARGSAYQTAMIGNRVPTQDGTTATALANVARQLPFRIASVAGATNHDISVTTGAGITVAGTPAFAGTTTAADSVWHTATLTRNISSLLPTVSGSATETAVVYTDTVNKAILNQYAYFGWWERRPALVGAAHNVEAFAGGTNPVIGSTVGGTVVTASNFVDGSATSPTNVVGTATYNGTAAGKYTNRMVGAGNVVTSIDAGNFTANATLTANFGTAANPLVLTTVTGGVLVSGTINGFALSSGNPAPWVVALNQDANGLGTATAGTPNAAGANDNGLLASTTTLTIGAGIQRTGAGNWVGEFFGPRTQAITGGATQMRAPQTIVGTFDASDRQQNPLLTIHGAFGAQTTAP